MKNYKAALLGTGMIMNGAHIPAIQALGGRIGIVAVGDERGEAARFTAKRLGNPPVYTDISRMLAESGADILINCTPNAYHKKFTIAGLEAGMHVVTEKPVALRYQDAKDILAACAKTGKKFFPAQTGRFTNENITIKRWVDEGLLGELYFADLDIIRRRGIPRWGQFHMVEHNLGGAFCDMAVHNIDALLSFTGNPAFKTASASFFTKISGSGEDVIISNKESGAYENSYIPRRFDPRDVNVEEFATGLLRLGDDLSVSFRVAWVIDLPEKSAVRLAGTKGGLVTPDMYFYKTVGECQAEIRPKVFDNTSNAIANWGHWVCYERILEDLDGGRPYPVLPEEILNTASILEGVYTSAKLQREVTAAEIIG